ncbi:interferon lambda-2-like [Rhynchocyon petersi]
MKLDKAVSCLLVLMLTAMLTRTGAIPTPAPREALGVARDCHIAQFKSLSPKELQIFQEAINALEKSLLLKNWTCGSPVFPKAWDLRRLQVHERLVALEAELALTLRVLKALTNSSLNAVLSRPLHTLNSIHSELQTCTLAQPTADPRPQGRLHRWLNWLQEASEKESESCLEASVTFNLFRLLLLDLKCVALGDQCSR